MHVSREQDPGAARSAAGLFGKVGLWTGGGSDAAGLTLAWDVNASHDGGRWRRSDAGLNAVLSLPAGPGTVHLNAGTVAEREPRRNRATWGAATTAAVVASMSSHMKARCEAPGLWGFTSSASPAVAPQPISSIS